MSPTYHNMQLVILDRHDKEFSYGDVIAFWCEELTAVLVKRVAACPGDMVSIENGSLFVNGCVSEVYSDEGMFDYAGILSVTVELNAEQYIAIGDNVAESKDSRYTEVGCVTEASILGKIVSD